MQGPTVDVAPDVVCLGEALVLLPALAGEQAGAVSIGALPAGAVPMGALPAGAEANVAVGLAAAGLRPAWVGRVGDDPFGAFLLAGLRARGVDVGGVQVDPRRPTGCYAKEAGIGSDGEPATRMHYRRAGSAASAMDPAFLGVPAVRDRLAAARIIHCSGITAALSPTCAEVMRALLAGPGAAMVSFDVNWREQMWPGGDPAVVADLAARADIVLVGADEARRVFGTDDLPALRRLLPGPRLIVVKDGADAALTIDRHSRVVRQSALQVDVVEPVGAGDAFAAGLLAGLVRHEPVARCLRRGHLGAAAVLTVADDSAPPPDDALLDLSEAEWAQIRVSAAGVR